MLYMASTRIRPQKIDAEMQALQEHLAALPDLRTM